MKRVVNKYKPKKLTPSKQRIQRGLQEFNRMIKWATELKHDKAIEVLKQMRARKSVLAKAGRALLSPEYCDDSNKWTISNMESMFNIKAGFNLATGAIGLWWVDSGNTHAYIEPNQYGVIAAPI